MHFADAIPSSQGCEGVGEVKASDVLMSSRGASDVDVTIRSFTRDIAIGSVEHLFDLSASGTTATAYRRRLGNASHGRRRQASSRQNAY